jgi:transposase InsO family protein
VAHAKARLNEFGRRLLVERVVRHGWTVVTAAEASGVSRATAYKWVRRFEAEGVTGLADRSSRPHRSPRRTAARLERRVATLRRREKLGPQRLSSRLGLPRSTCYAVLCRQGLHRLDWLDRPTGRVVRRYERERPGELVHVDVKKLGRIPPGGGHKVHGRGARPNWKRGLGYDYIHSCVDDHSRLAYSEILADEQGTTCAAFLLRAARFFADYGVAIERVMTDNAFAYRHSRAFRDAVAQLGARHILIRPHHPETNGKVERFNRTLLEEWAYVRPYTSNAQRVRLLPAWLHLYNHHRTHTALGGRSPAQRVNNLPGRYT